MKKGLFNDLRAAQGRAANFNGLKLKESGNRVFPIPGWKNAMDGFFQQPASTILKMKKVIAYSVMGAILGLTGCSLPKTSTLETFPFVYKMTVQQGNIITTEMVDQLELGMTKSQVEFLLGTPMLTDLFHLNRWDYAYTIRRDHNEMAVTHLTLLFEDDSLVQIQGDLRPDPDRAAQRQPTDLLVSVPDWQDDRGFFARILLAPDDGDNG